MDATLTQILRALVEAHAWRDQAESEIERLHARVAELEARDGAATEPD